MTQNTAIHKKHHRPATRLTALLLVLTLLLSFLALPANAATAAFGDVPSDSWYYSYVRTAYMQGLMQGTSTTTFEPEGTVTRAMFVTVLGRLAGINTASYQGATTFADVPTGQWYSPYVAWAQETGVTTGYTETMFGPDNIVTREQMATFIARYLSNTHQTLPASSDATAVFTDRAAISAWAAESVETLRITALFLGDDRGCFNPASGATRAEAATVFVRLNTALHGSNIPTVNTWPEQPEVTIPDVANPIVSKAALLAAAEEYSISTTSNAFKALISINTVYSPKLTAAQRSGTLVFLFEGVGSSANPELRTNAMCVVVKGGNLVYLTQNASTIPDYPFNPAKNGGKDMPTLMSGIYSFKTVNHTTANGSYAGLNVVDAKVVRFHDQNTFYTSTSTGINIHRRSTEELSDKIVNSAGCQVVGKIGTAPTDEYAQFIHALGIVPPTAAGNVRYSYYVTGVVVIDRTYAGSYLHAIGYPAGGISMIG